MSIHKNINIEELIDILPEAVEILRKEGIRCIQCGEPIWGTLKQAAKEKGIKEEKISKIVLHLNNILKEKKNL